MGLLGRQRAYAQYQYYVSMNSFEMLTDVQTIALLRQTAASGSSILRLGGQPGGC